MTPERWREVKQILEEALDHEGPERTRYLTVACGEDEDLRREVESLLAAETEAASFIEEPLFHLREVTDEVSLVGRRVDRYEVLEEIGRGGMGTVYLAVRADDTYEQRVALKILKRGLDTDEIVHRFRNERQILANLEHPNIARLIDGGSTEDGRPYLVMEHVVGRPIDRYCDEEELGLEERLDLFRTVCSALDYAHRNLIIHRDLKPSNILVTEEGVPKLLDFGIAKLLSPRGMPTAATIADLQFLTPQYASPEQIRGEQVTTGTDVYSLGVLLYALLTGRRPYTPDTPSARAMERLLDEVEPPRPSSVAEGERGRRLAGDLDNILLTALAKEPERRYPSVEQLDADLERYQEGLPVQAAGDSLTYRVGKFVGRHKVGVSAAAAILTLILVSGITATVLWGQAVEERRRAETVSSFLVELLSSSRPAEARGRDVTVREVLDEGRARIAEEFEEEPALRARLTGTMARAYRDLGYSETAEALATQTLKLCREVFGPESLEVADSLNLLASVARELGDDERAVRLIEQALPIQRRHRSPEHEELLHSLNNLAVLYRRLGRLEEAETLQRELLATKRRLYGPDHPEVGTALNNLARVFLAEGRPENAVELYREVLAIRRAAHGGAAHPQVANTLNALGSALESAGDLDAAEARYREALAMRRTLYPEGHQRLAGALSNLALFLQRRGRRDEPAALLREALATPKAQLPEDHWYRGVFLRNLAALQVERGEAAACQETLDQSLAILRARKGPGHWRTADAESVLGACLTLQERYAEAESLLLESFERLRAARGRGATQTTEARRRLTDLYTAWGKPERAAAYR